jgi:hypothetical protein
MMITWLLIAHIGVLGYWLGSEVVINSTYRLVCYAEDMPFDQREQLMDHVMHIDQHVRYALVLQTSLGVMLAASYGFIPGGTLISGVAAVLGTVWLGFVEAVHRLRRHPAGGVLAKIDRGSRYVLIAALVATAIGLLGRTWPVPDWLRWKMAVFAGVVACGVAIRIVLLAHFRTWARMAEGDVTPENNAIIKRTYKRATSVLILLWALIAIVVFLSVTKPG